MRLTAHTRAHPAAQRCEPAAVRGNSAEGDRRRSAPSQPRYRGDLYQDRHRSLDCCRATLAGECSMTASMQHLVQEYLDERRSVGFALTISGARLLAFARFADASGHRGPLTRQLITRWARDEAKGTTPLTWTRRIEIIRPFAKHRARLEPG